MAPQQHYTLSVDAMSGDHGPQVMVEAADIARLRIPHARFLFFGQKEKVQELVSRYPLLEKVSSIEHTKVVVSMDEKPSRILRHGRNNSSMWRSIEAVRDGKAHAVLSSGNTGALMVMAGIILKKIDKIDRLALACLWPTLRGDTVVLDVGATTDAKTRNLVHFALMGEAFAQAVFHKKRPRVALLNVGNEQGKGPQYLKEVATTLYELKDVVDFCGFAEGMDIGKGLFDVVVTDGFSGNIALKTAEGTARQISGYIKDVARSSLLAKLGFFLASNSLATLRTRINPNSANAGIFLGLNGLVVKSHGSASAFSAASAMEMALDVARENLLEKINSNLNKSLVLLEQEIKKQTT